jgi:transcriptional repressor NrdR
MICHKCLHTRTRVTNSRVHKKTAQVWRRRYCEKCGSTFTTYERLALSDEITVKNKNGEIQPFNSGILIIDLFDALERSDTNPAANAYWLARSIEDDIAVFQADPITTDRIKQLSHDTLSRFNTLAGIQYAAKHKLLDKIKRPRRRV